MSNTTVEKTKKRKPLKKSCVESLFTQENLPLIHFSKDISRRTFCHHRNMIFYGGRKKKNRFLVLVLHCFCHLQSNKKRRIDLRQTVILSPLSFSSFCTQTACVYKLEDKFSRQVFSSIATEK